MTFLVVAAGVDYPYQYRDWISFVEGFRECRASMASGTSGFGQCFTLESDYHYRGSAEN